MNLTTLLFLAPLPPPTHGVTVISLMAKRIILSQGYEIDEESIGQSKSIHQMGSAYGRKLLRLGVLLLKSVRVRQNSKYDIAYCTLSPFGVAQYRDFLVMLSGMLRAKRCLVHVHAEGLDEILYSKGFVARLLRRLFARIEVLCVTSRAYKTCLQSGRFERVWLIPNAIDGPKDAIAVKHNKLRLLYLGNLIPEKGVMEFIQVLHLLCKWGIRFDAKIVGAPSGEISIPYLRSTSEDLKLGTHLEICGPLYDENKTEVLKWANVLVYPSRHDHSPLVVIEAMANSVVPIVYKTGGVPELLGHALRDYVVDIDSNAKTRVENMAVKVLSLSQTPHALTNAMEAARLRYVSTYSHEVFSNNLRRILLGVKRST